MKGSATRAPTSPIIPSAPIVIRDWLIGSTDPCRCVVLLLIHRQMDIHSDPRQ